MAFPILDFPLNPMSRADLDTRLSDRLAASRPSATGAVSELARRLAAEGRSVISLSEGELDFDTPAHIQQAAIDAIKGGRPATPAWAARRP